MADYVSREVARERLRKACKMGSIASVLLILAALASGGIAALVGLGVRLPFEFMYDVLYALVPNMGDAVVATSECATRAVLFFLMGLFGLLMYRKMSKTGDAFRLGQLRQLKFQCLLIILLGFMPTLVGNIAKFIVAILEGTMPFAALYFEVDAMCVLGGLLAFLAARVLVAGAVLGRQEEEVATSVPVADVPAPDFTGVPDLANVTTAAPVMGSTAPAPVMDPTAPTPPLNQASQVPTAEEMPHFVSDPAWDDLAAQIDAAAGQANQKQ